MSLGYDISGALPDLRRQAESRFTEVFDFFTSVEGAPETGSFEPVRTETPVRSGVRGRLKFTNTMGRDIEAASQFPVIQRLEVHVAVGSVDVRPGVFVRVRSSDADTGLVGRVFRVAERSTAGQVTAWRYPVEDV